MPSKLETDALTALGPLAKSLGKTAGSLWKIFVRQYIARGIACTTVALASMGLAVWLLGDRSLWLLLIAPLPGFFLYWGIQYLINPYYPAMDDVIVHVKNVTKPPASELMIHKDYLNKSYYQ